MSEEKEALMMSSIYLYESVLRKVDVKLDEIHNLKNLGNGSDGGESV